MITFIYKFIKLYLLASRIVSLFLFISSQPLYLDLIYCRRRPLESLGSDPCHIILSRRCRVACFQKQIQDVDGCVDVSVPNISYASSVFALFHPELFVELLHRVKTAATEHGSPEFIYEHNTGSL